MKPGAWLPTSPTFARRSFAPAAARQTASRSRRRRFPVVGMPVGELERMTELAEDGGEDVRPDQRAGADLADVLPLGRGPEDDRVGPELCEQGSQPAVAHRGLHDDEDVRAGMPHLVEGPPEGSVVDAMGRRAKRVQPHLGGRVAGGRFHLPGPLHVEARSFAVHHHQGNAQSEALALGFRRGG